MELKQNFILKTSVLLAEFFQSLFVVIFFMLALIVFQTFESRKLFYDALSGLDNEGNRLIASLLIAVVFEATQLIFSVNKDKFFDGMPYVIAGFSLIINILFFQVWVGSIEVIVTKSVASVLIASLSFYFTELFVKKWNAVKRLVWMHKRQKDLKEFQTELKDKEQSLNELQQTLKTSEQTQKEFQLNLDKKEEHLLKAEQNMKRAEEELTETQEKTNKLLGVKKRFETEVKDLKTKKEELDQFIEKRYCPKCDRYFSHPQGKNSHKCQPVEPVEEKTKQKVELP